MIDEYALYKGDEFISLGTIKEISNETGMTEGALRQLLSPSYLNRIIDKNKCKILIRLGDKNKDADPFVEEKITWSKDEADKNGAMRYSKEERKKYRKIAEENGINKYAYYGRLRKGWDIERAATEKVRESQKGIKKKCEELGVSYNTYRDRKYNQGLNDEEALIKKPRRIIDRKLVELAKSNGISYSLLWDRMFKRKWEEQRAATEPPKHK